MPSLQDDLHESHRDLRQWLLFHQECLLLGDADKALLAWQAFSRILGMHIDFENRYLLQPEVEGRQALRWPVNVYRKEHDKLLAMQVDINTRLSQYAGFDGRYRRLALLELLDVELRFVHVLEHHEQREEDDLLTSLAAMPEAENLSRQWRAINNELDDEFAASKGDIRRFLENA